MLTVTTIIALVTMLPPLKWKQTPGYPISNTYSVSENPFTQTKSTNSNQFGGSQGIRYFDMKVTGSTLENKPVWNSGFTPLQNVRDSAPWSFTRTLLPGQTMNVILTGSREVGTDSWDMFEADYYTLSAVRERNWQSGWIIVCEVTPQ